MTREDIECIIKWFSHIEQLATDGKTANGFQMPIEKLLPTIKVIAKDSREYVEKFCNENIPKDLEESAVDIADALLAKPKDYALSAKADYWNGAHDGVIAGAKWQKEQNEKFENFKEYIDNALISIEEAREQGRQEMKEQMMKDYSWLVSPCPNIEQKADIIHTTDTAPVDGKELLYVADKSYKIGWRDCKEQLLKEAVEADVNTYRDLAAGKSWAEFVVEMQTNNLGDKVRIIICKKED